MQINEFAASDKLINELSQEIYGLSIPELATGQLMDSQTMSQQPSDYRKFMIKLRTHHWIQDNMEGALKGNGIEIRTKEKLRAHCGAHNNNRGRTYMVLRLKGRKYSLIDFEWIKMRQKLNPQIDCKSIFQLILHPVN